MNDNETITPQYCVDADPWDLATKLGVEYTGDMDTIPCDGTFYRIDEYGDCQAVRIMSIEDEGGMLWVESGIFVLPEDFDPETQWVDEHPFEVDEDFTGRYQKLFRGDDEYGEFDELAVWNVALPWVYGIAS